LEIGAEFVRDSNNIRLESQEGVSKPNHEEESEAWEFNNNTAVANSSSEEDDSEFNTPERIRKRRI
jgi:hypothetical protein